MVGKNVLPDFVLKKPLKTTKKNKNAMVFKNTTKGFKKPLVLVEKPPRWQHCGRVGRITDAASRGGGTARAGGRGVTG